MRPQDTFEGRALMGEQDYEDSAPADYSRDLASAVRVLLTVLRYNDSPAVQAARQTLKRYEYATGRAFPSVRRAPQGLNAAEPVTHPTESDPIASDRPAIRPVLGGGRVSE